MIIIKKMFWIYTLPFLFLIGYILVAFIFKVIKEVIDSYEGKIPEPFYSKLKVAMYNYEVEMDD